MRASLHTAITCNVTTTPCHLLTEAVTSCECDAHASYSAHGTAMEQQYNSVMLGGTLRHTALQMNLQAAGAGPMASIAAR